ncbi:hypothetical protein ACFLT3_01515 [Chloroflexota bacterium]
MVNAPERIPASYLDRAIGFINFLIDPMIQLELKFSEEIDIGRLQKAVNLILNAEPILGCRLVSHWYSPYFQRMSSSFTNDAFYTTESIEEFDTFRSALIDTYQGPQLKVYHYHSSNEDRIIIKVAHNITDVAGLNNIARIISSVYSRLKDNPAYELAPNLNTSRGLRIVTRHLKWYAYPRIYLNYFQGLLAQMPRQGTHTLHLEEGPLKPLEFVCELIPEERVAYLKEYGYSNNATLNDLIVAAIFRALIVDEDWNRQSHLRLITSVDLRRWYLSSEEGKAITNLSGMEVISLNNNIGDDFPATLKRVVSFIEKRKSSYIGLSDLIGSLPIMIMPDRLGQRMYKKVVQRAIDRGNIAPGLTNMGEIEVDAVTFDYPPDSAQLIAPPYYPPYFLIGLSGFKGTLSLSSIVRPAHKDRVNRFLENVLSQLPV